MLPFDLEDVLEIGLSFFLAQIATAVLVGMLGFGSMDEMLEFISRKFN
jgi:hypothetical protein